MPNPTPTPSPSPRPTRYGPGDAGLTEEDRKSYFQKGYEEGVSAGVKRAEAARGAAPKKEGQACDLKKICEQPYRMLLIGFIAGLILGILIAKYIL